MRFWKAAGLGSCSDCLGRLTKTAWHCADYCRTARLSHMWVREREGEGDNCETRSKLRQMPWLTLALSRYSRLGQTSSSCLLLHCSTTRSYVQHIFNCLQLSHTLICVCVCVLLMCQQINFSFYLDTELSSSFNRAHTDCDNSTHCPPQPTDWAIGNNVVFHFAAHFNGFFTDQK